MKTTNEQKYEHLLWLILGLMCNSTDKDMVKAAITMAKNLKDTFVA